jgi:hypothetical protein
MSIQKKSLISTLKTTKKANVASAPTKIEAGKSNVGLTPARRQGFLTKGKSSPVLTKVGKSGFFTLAK